MAAFLSKRMGGSNYHVFTRTNACFHLVRFQVEQAGAGVACQECYPSAGWGTSGHRQNHVQNKEDKEYTCGVQVMAYREVCICYQVGGSRFKSQVSNCGGETSQEMEQCCRGFLSMCLFLPLFSISLCLSPFIK